MTKKRILALFICALIATPLTFCCAKRKGKLGSKENPIQFYFMPLKGEKVFQANAAIIKQFVQDKTGLVVETIHAPDFVSIVKALGQKKADIAFMNTLGYLLARDWAKAEAHLRYIYGDVYYSYRGEILARSDSTINEPKDINGKSIAFADPYSAGGYLYPLKFLKDNNIKPKRTVFAGGHLKAVEMVYKKEVDTAATYHARPSPIGAERDARIELLEKYPDIVVKVKIVALTDDIPNGPVALRHDIPGDIKEKLVAALLDFSKTPAARTALINLYNITGLTSATDADYDGVQKTIRELGKTIQEMVPGGAPYYKTAIELGLE